MAVKLACAACRRFQRRNDPDSVCKFQHHRRGGIHDRRNRRCTRKRDTQFAHLTAPIRAGGRSPSTTRRSTCLFAPAIRRIGSARWTELEGDPTVKVVVFQSANPDYASPISTWPRQLNGQRCWASGADFVLRLASTPVVNIAKISRPHARHRQRVRAGLRHALRRTASAPYSATPRSASDWSRAAGHWNGSAFGRPLTGT